MPKLGMTMEEGKIVEWRKKEKEWVNKGEILLVIETDKVTYEVESNDSGMLVILIDSGEGIPVGTVLGRLAASEAEYGELKGKAPAKTGPAAAPAVEAPDLEKREKQQREGPVRATPGARKLAKESGVDLASVVGTGPEGRITREDVQAYLEKPAAAAAPPTSSAERAPAFASAPVIEKGRRLWKSERMSGMRATISRRMMQSLQQSAQMTAIAQWDVSNLLGLRKEINKTEDAQGFRVSIPGLMVFFLARVLKEMPLFNASIEGNEIHYWEDVNIGCAVSVSDGLVVPVIHGANRMSLKAIQIRLDDLIERARNKKLLPDDMAGGTFTLSNLGSYGSEFETVILNPPEVALLGIGAAEKKPVVVDDAIVIRQLMPVSLTFDHRVIDGAAAGEFRQRLRRLVENPGMLATCSNFGF
jgi:pyruvate/2-oxoglutarate dehydrogenase complex dihydrolipoamide acyltransferase (E2) component